MGYSLVERPEARYRVIYGRHDRTTPASELPSQYDVLFLEGMSSEFEIGDLFSLKNHEQYSVVAKNAQEQNAKIYFGDIPIKRFSLKIRERNLLPDWPVIGFIRAGEIGIGIELACLLAEETKKREKISRRSFLKKVGLGAAAAWNLSLIGKSGSIFFKERQEIPRALERMIAAEDPLHPEDLSGWFRNAVAAKKLISIGRIEQIRLGRKTEVAVIFGANHTGLAEFLRKGEETCKKVVKLYPQWFLRAMIKDGKLGCISVIVGAQFNPRHGFWMVSDRFLDEGLYFSVNREQEYLNPRKEIR